MSEYRFNQDVSTESQRGAVLILIALMLIVIFGLAALAIELTSYSTAISQARNSANLAALGALEDSMAGDMVDQTQLLLRARERAQKVSNYNIALGNEHAGGEIGHVSSYGPDASGKATLIAGKYYYAKPTASDPCGGSSKYPCFVPGLDAGDRPSAFKVVGELFPPHTFDFAKAAFGSSAAKKPIKVQSVATVVPRRGCFLVAGSPSNESRLTHLLAGADKSDPAYVWDESSTDPNKVTDQAYRDRWGDMGGNRGAVTPSSRYETKHFKDDYVKSTTVIAGGVTGVISDSDYFANPDFAKYHPAPPNLPADEYVPHTALQKRVWQWDAYPPASINDYNGPEPMGTIFEGLKTAIEAFKERAVTGDEACIVFFQRNVRWPAIVKLTSDFDYLLKLVDSSKWPTRTAWIQNLYQHNIFPEFFSQTDMNAALSEAAQQFAAEKTAKPGMPSAEFVVLISDGIQTCFTCTPPVGPVPFDFNGDKKVDDIDKAAFDDCFNGVSTPAACAWADSNGDGGVLNDMTDKFAFDRAYADPANACNLNGTSCSNDYSNYVQGIGQVLSRVRTDFAPRKIPIHVIQIGPHVVPYSVDIETDPPQSPKKCMSEYEKRGSGDLSKLSVPSMEPGCQSVNGTLNCDSLRADSFRCRNPNESGCGSVSQFTESNSFMYQIALMTNGLWAPIREADTGCSGTEAKCNPGIVTKDPKCRTTKDQMKDYMTEIMGQNPYTIVEQ